VDNIEHALSQPPALGRARWRGEYVQRHAAENQRYSANWTGVYDAQTRLMLDLSQPFPDSPEWTRMPQGAPPVSQAVREHLRQRLARARSQLDVGHYEEAYFALHEARLHDDFFEASDRCESLRLLAWIQGRRGFLDSTTTLDQLAQMREMTFALANDYVCAWRYQGLIPPPAIEPWIEKGRAFMEQNDESSLGTVVPFLDHWGYTRLRNGHALEAHQLLERACRPERLHSANDGAVARALADFADACRALGRREEAARALAEAGRVQLENQSEGDYADFTLTGRAKLEANPARALALLAEAKETQARSGNVMGETRTLLLEARLARNPELPATIKGKLRDFREKRPALLKCPMLAKIFDNWKAWIRGDPDPEGGSDAYWWL
jgi:hypothetical protein